MNLAEGFPEHYTRLPEEKRTLAREVADGIRPLLEALLKGRPSALITIPDGRPGVIDSKSGIRAGTFNNADYLVQFYNHNDLGDQRMSGQELYAFYSDGVLKRYTQQIYLHTRHQDGSVSILPLDSSKPESFHETSADSLREVKANLENSKPR